MNEKGEKREPGEVAHPVKLALQAGGPEFDSQIPCKEKAGLSGVLLKSQCWRGRERRSLGAQ